MVKNILVASELNKVSYEALAYGITLGLMYDAKVSCIHVIKPSPLDVIKETFLFGSDQYGEAFKNAKKESENLLSHIIDVIGRELGIGEVDVDLKIVSGNLSKSIITHAEEIEADLVIIGTETGSRFSKTPHTNLALNIIKLQKMNVLLIPDNFRLERLDQIGAFINFEVGDIHFIDRLCKFSKRTENGPKLIHIVENKADLVKANELLLSFKRLLEEEIKKFNIKFIVEVGDVASVVNALKEKHGIDLVMIRAYHRHWEAYTAVEFSNTIIKNIKSPLMVLKSNMEEAKVIG